MNYKITQIQRERLNLVSDSLLKVKVNLTWIDILKEL